MPYILNTKGQKKEFILKKKKIQLEELYKIVQEPIEIIWINKNEVMVITEQGKIPNVNPNNLASELIKKNGREHLLPNGGEINGDVFVCSLDQID